MAAQLETFYQTVSQVCFTLLGFWLALMWIYPIEPVAPREPVALPAPTERSVLPDQPL